MTLAELKVALDAKLAKPFSSRVLLDNLRLIDESSRHTSAYTDPLYIPVYYHLGSLLKPKSIVEIGFRLGLFSSCFLKGCKETDTVLGFQEGGEEYYSPRLGRANVLQNAPRAKVTVHVGDLYDEAFHREMRQRPLELCLINEETGYDKHMQYLDCVWPHLAADAFLVTDYLTKHKPAGEAFRNFARSKSSECVTFATRYGVGIIQKR